MKKFLLSMAVLAAAASVNAADIKVEYNGEEVKNGDVIVLDKYHDAEMGSMEFDVNVINTTDAEFSVTAGFAPVKVFEVDGEPASFMFCYETSWGAPGNCIAGTSFDIDVPAAGTLGVLVHYFLPNDEPAKSEAEYTIFAQKTGDDASKVEFTLKLNSPAPGDSGVAAVDMENVAPVYYNLQGVKVANPDKGIYLVKRGAKVTKEVR